MIVSLKLWIIWFHETKKGKCAINNSKRVNIKHQSQENSPTLNLSDELDASLTKDSTTKTTSGSIIGDSNDI